MRSFTYKNDNSAYPHSPFMSPDPYLFLILLSEHTSTTVMIILMICGRIIEQVNAEGRMQKRQIT